MKLSIAILSLVACLKLASCGWSATISDKNSIDFKWVEFKEKFNKIYVSKEEDLVRFGLFAKRMQQVNSHNLHSQASYKQDLNRFSDWTSDELSSLIGSVAGPHLDKVTATSSLGDFVGIREKDAVPEALDYSTDIFRVGPVGYQGRCGSHYAFAATGLVEGQQMNRISVVQPVTLLSVQQLVSCDNNMNFGCEGGSVRKAIDYMIKDNGLESERSYPYDSSDGKSIYHCQHEASKSVKYTTSFNQSQVFQGDEDQLKQLVASYGPIAVHLHASPDLASYKSGVLFTEDCLANQSINYAALLVGYGTDSEQGDYWILKNSWGQDWGLKGYFWLARNRNNHCGILSSPTLVY